MTFPQLKMRAGHQKLETTLRHYAAVDANGQDSQIVGDVRDYEKGSGMGSSYLSP